MNQSLQTDQVTGIETTEPFMTYLGQYAQPLLLIEDQMIAWCNRSLSDLIQIETHDLIGLAAATFIHPLHEFDDSKMTVHASSISHATGEKLPVEIRSSPLGHRRWMLSLSPQMGHLTDVDTELLRERLFALAEELPVGVFYAENGLRLAWVNKAMASIFERPRQDVLGTNWLECITPESRALAQEGAISSLLGKSTAVDVHMNSGSGALRTVRFSFSSITSLSRSAGFIGTLEDVSDERAEMEVLSFAALHDPLTGLPNRRALNSELAQLRPLVRDGSLAGVGIIFCDLNGFKAINDNLGHMAGDRLLIETANRLRATCRKSEVVYRYAGDEFVVLTTNPGQADEPDGPSRRFKDAMSRPVRLDKLEIQVSISIGFASTNSDNESLEQVLARADQSMYMDKRTSYAEKSEPEGS